MGGEVVWERWSGLGLKVVGLRWKEGGMIAL